ncbi:putative gtp-binding protein [Eutypa lata UCREL1]|uniref:Putative gtp-binding protein n=1 Tax=Eutypa lata (strain UCR-EL1) TaxID=1287681 RepID=M7TI69_EUTLA|nr:putative gtp-binding protein [Eutypa lata UCREL1]
MPLRSKNRRSRTGRYYHGQKTELSFIVTRSDLLAPTKPQVDKLLPYLQDVLRDVLGRSGRHVRLGNVRCVSAKRSWWTKELKEDIWKRGGAGWMVGKVNVGKSQLFEEVFPKGRMEQTPSNRQITVDMYARKDNDNPLLEDSASTLATQEDEGEHSLPEEDDLDAYSLLPPAPEETNYPQMPLVSDLPGTTASPIRVPFGNGRGELIDLPGVERTGLEHYVKEEHRSSLVMKSRIVPEQLVLKPGQSLLIGGFIRITPRDPSPIMLSYAFTPIKPHRTSTEKAIAIQEQTSEVNVDNIAAPGTGEKTKLAGSFELRWDVTRQRTGPLTRRDAVGLQVDRLPYRVLSTDILIEGVGWVELAAQVRTKDLFAPKPNSNTDSTGAPLSQKGDQEQPPEQEQQPLQSEKGLSALERLEAMAEDPNQKKKNNNNNNSSSKEKKTPPPLSPLAPVQVEEMEANWPIVDVYSPEGKFIGSRRPINGWMMNKPKVTAEQKRKRPRKSMKGAKKLDKQRRRVREAGGSGGGGGSSSF